MDDNLCKQKAISQKYNTPLPRFDLNSINPYLSGNFTKMQLDMRRKAEVLKYSANKSSSQTNNLTKRQKFALLVRGGTQTPSQTNVQTPDFNCDADNLILTPTSSSDVPGPIVYLYDDETVPLYNYSDYSTRSYPSYVPNDSKLWNFVILSDVLTTDFASATIYNLILKNTIDQPQYTYNIVTPISISFSGNNYQTNPYKTITITAQTAKLTVYYNENAIHTYNAIMDTSLNLNFNVSPSVTKFSALQFIGNLTFNGIFLYTAPTYVYSFEIQIDAKVSSADPLDLNASNFMSNSGFSYNIIANASSVPNVNSGCSNVTSSTGIFNPGASIVAL